MASIIEGYNYDIFISYRQKDNKGDRWVSEFVDALKDELESTFKEEISVYFDINPHDGLLETHDVNASLKEKLKSVIFIPILSQTYCDPKSFAWQHEFVAYNKMAREDIYGRDITLANGNVGSRILPVKIHELDADDQRVFEDETGAVLRAIEFIYKEPGVNRPLSPDDETKENLNRTKYRNQVNKVANAVKEIIYSMRNPDQKDGTGPGKMTKTESAPSKKLNRRTIITSAIALTLIVLGLIFIPKMFKSSEQVEKSIAVLPFRNDSPDDSTKYFMDGVMEEILTNLQTIKELRVISRTSVEQYRDNNKPITDIAKELDVNYIVEGSGQKSGNSIRMRVQLIRAEKESHIWAKSYNSERLNLTEYFNIQSQFAEEIANELNAAITPEEKVLIERIPTRSLDAYEAYLKGQFYWRKITANDLETSMKYFELSIQIDPDFALAYAGISDVWLGRQQMGIAPPDEAGAKAAEAAMKALELDSTRAEVHYTLALMYTWGMFEWEAGVMAFKKAINLKPAYPEAHAYYSHLLNFLGYTREAKEQGLLATRQDPANPLVISLYAVDLLFSRQYEEAIKTADEALKMDPTAGVALYARAAGLHNMGRYMEAFNAWESYYSTVYKDLAHVFDQNYIEGSYAQLLHLEADAYFELSKNTYVPATDIAQLYILAGDKNRTIDLLEKAFAERDPNLPYLLQPLFDSLRDDPRFQEVARKMNLPYKY